MTPHIAAQPRGNALGDIAEIVQALAHELAPGAAFMEGVR
jgi:hypothetical protein